MTGGARLALTMSWLLRRPIVYAVTDRRQLAPGATDRRACAEVEAFVDAAALGSVDVVQIRERDLAGGDLGRLVGRCVRRLEGSATAVLVNERLDVALETGAAGVHLRADSVPAARVRGLTPGGIVVGRSSHGIDATLRDPHLDYALYGTVYASASKARGHRIAGPSGFSAAIEVASIPLVAIGGVTAARAAELAALGAAGVAGIGLFVDAYGQRRGAGIARLVERLRRSFDSPSGLV